MQPDSSLFHVESCTVGYGPRRISVKLRQALDPDYGLFVWPSAHVLAHYLWKENYSSSPLSGCNILELGAGTGLAGIAAALLGARVTLTDKADSPVILSNLKENCRLNGLAAKAEVEGFSWGWVPPHFAHKRFDLIIGADVFYSPELHEDLVATLSALFEFNPKAVFLTAYHPRSFGRSLHILLDKWQLASRTIDLRHAQGDSAMADICRSDLDPEQVLPPSTASIELYEIRPL